MSETRFTEGEWVQATGVGYCCIRTGSMDDRAGQVIADMRIVDGYYNPFDATLIAAARDIYEALQNLLDSYGYIDFLSEEERRADPDFKAATHALAKARGETQ